MKFNVRVSNNGTEEVWTWGTNSCSVTDASGKRRNPKGHEWQPAQDNPIGRGPVRLLEVFLGYNCNLNCTYCYQREDKANYKGCVASTRHVPEFIEMLKASGIDLYGVHKVIFFGGEPLVFLKVIQDLAPRLKSLMPNARFAITSNGTLLRESTTDWLKAMGFNVSVSCDGSEDGRGVNVLELKTKELLYAKQALGDSFWIQPTASAGNEDYELIVNRIRKVLGDDVNIGVLGPTRCFRSDSNNVDSCLLDHEKYTESMYHVLTGDKPTSAKYRVIRVVNIIKSRQQPQVRAGYCYAAKGRGITTDLEGNLYKCHAKADAPIGHLLDWKNQDLTAFTSPLKRKVCLKCPFVGICKGGCSLLEESGFEITCKNTKAEAYAYFKAAWKKLFGVDVLEVSPHGE